MAAILAAATYPVDFEQCPASAVQQNSVNYPAWLPIKPARDRDLVDKPRLNVRSFL